jgi:D-alanyl-D-alanine carboxypeptidase (penicillin-binding protein 5/6)
MQRYLSLPFFVLFSIVFLLQPSVELQGAQLPVLQGKSKQSQETANRPAPKVKVAAKKGTVKNTSPQKTQTAKARKPAQKKKNSSRKKVAQHVSPQKARSSTSTKKQAVVVKRKSTPVPTVSRKKSQSIAAQSPVYHGKAVGLPDITRQISSKSVMVMDAGSGETIFAKAPDNPRQPASTIKIVTAMIALKSLKLNDTINVSYRAAGMPSSKIYLDPKQNYRANDLINAVLLASANDASVALAEKIAGTEAKFAKLMTLSAKMWGARNTVCRTASGLTAEGQHSTARDLANLFRFAMQHNEFSKRMREKKISTSYGKTLLNHNKALWRVDGAVAGKTGYTVAARQTYVGQFTRNDETIVVAIMGSETMWADLKKLVEYGFMKKKHEQLAQVRTGDAAHKGTLRFKY